MEAIFDEQNTSGGRICFNPTVKLHDQSDVDLWRLSYHVGRLSEFLRREQEDATTGGGLVGGAVVDAEVATSNGKEIQTQRSH
jgi:hypothetical protein